MTELTPAAEHPPAAELTPVAVVGLLAEPARLAAFAAAALGARTPAEVAHRAGLAPRAAAQAHQRLTAAGLLTGAGAVDLAALRVLARDASEPTPVQDHGHPDPAAERTLRTFLRDGRLTALPAQQGRRRVLLQHLAAAFAFGVRYPEKEVDAVLRASSDGPDHATLRRYLVVDGLLSRADGEYWRASTDLHRTTQNT